MAKGFQFSGCRISSLIFSDVVLLTWSGDGQLTLEWEAVGMRISNFKSEAIVLSWKRISWPLRVRGKLRPMRRRLGISRSCSRVMGRGKQETDRQTGDVWSRTATYNI